MDLGWSVWWDSVMGLRGFVFVISLLSSFFLFSLFRVPRSFKV